MEMASTLFNERRSFEMPLISTRQHRGHTVLVNMQEVSDLIGFIPECPMKYFGIELRKRVRIATDCSSSSLCGSLSSSPSPSNSTLSGSTVTAVAAPRTQFSISGLHSEEKIQALFEDFVNTFVLCSLCRRPGCYLTLNPTLAFNDNSQGIGMQCDQCGYSTLLRPPLHKITKYMSQCLCFSSSTHHVNQRYIRRPPRCSTPGITILQPNNPNNPVTATTIHTAGSRRSNDVFYDTNSDNSDNYDDDDDDDDDEDEDDDDPYATRDDCESDGEEDDDVDWGVDMGKDAIARRLSDHSAHIDDILLKQLPSRKLSSSNNTANIVDDDTDTPYFMKLDMLKRFVESLISPPPSSTTSSSSLPGSIGDEIHRLNIDTAAALEVVLNVLFAVDAVRATLERHSQLLKGLARTNSDQMELLNAIEGCMQADARLIPKTEVICVSLYDFDVIDEDTFAKWGESKECANVKPDLHLEILLQARKFLEWLQTAEEEDDEEEEDDDDDSGSDEDDDKDE